MKRVIRNSLVITTMICSLCCYINLLSATFTEKLLFGIGIGSGYKNISSGFGIKIVTNSEPFLATKTKEVSFSISDFLIFILFVFAFVLLVIFLIYIFNHLLDKSKMRKKLKESLKLSLTITWIVSLASSFVNYICAHFFEILPIGFHIRVGEYDGYMGFGIILENISPMVPSASEDSHFLVSLSLKDFLVFFVLTFILVFLIVSVIKLLRGKK